MYPEYVEIDGKRFKINTDFRYAIRCNEIAEDETIGDLERAMAIIYTLYGDAGLEASDYYNQLLEKAQIYLLCGKEYERSNELPDMDFIEDYAYIKTSFRSDYGMNLDNEKIHWWEFMDLMNGLSNSEFGNCCILNRIRNLRNYDTKDIKDLKTKQKINEAKKKVALKKYQKKVELTEEQKESVNNILKDLGIRKE